MCCRKAGSSCIAAILAAGARLPVARSCRLEADAATVGHAVCQAIRRCANVAVLGLWLSGCGSPADIDAGGRQQVAGSVLLARVRSLETRLAGGADATEAARVNAELHQLRNADAMLEMVTALPPAERPASILYLAAGSHLAPLDLCEALPAGAPCTLRLTEINPAVQGPIQGLLETLRLAGTISDLVPGDTITGPAGERRWRFGLAGHPVTLELVVRTAGEGGAPPPLVLAADLDQARLVVSHDLTGDPLGNLRVIQQYMLAAREADLFPPPPLMMEDLERHPYPVDLSLFVPRARSALPYGHRTSDAGVGRHGGVELGPPLFAGGVLLTFSDPWWREVEPATLAGVLDFLLLNESDTRRQNVLEGGAEPLLAPALLDWWTGFGYRTIAEQDLRGDPAARQRMLAAVQAVLPRLSRELGQRLACRVRLYRSLLELEAAGGDLRPLLPSARPHREPQPGGFPSPQMEELYRAAEARGELYRHDEEQGRLQARELLVSLASPGWQNLLASCPVELPSAGGDWAATYRSLAAWLAVPQP